MPDFPIVETGQSLCSVSTVGLEGLVGQLENVLKNNASAGVWTTASTALYMPITISAPLLAQQMAVDVSVQAGNLDLGIYTENGTRLVSAGSTAVGAAGVQAVNIADTWLAAGTYFVAMNCDSGTASFVGYSIQMNQTRSSGIMEQAVGAVALPSPATFATMSATRQIPAVLVAGVATV